MARLARSGDFTRSYEEHLAHSVPGKSDYPPYRNGRTDPSRRISVTSSEKDKPVPDELNSGLSTKVKFYVYLSHSLSAWGDRMWYFGVGLFLVIIAPESLLLTAVFGFTSGGSVLLVGPLIGSWVDNTPRLTAARVTMFVQNISVIIAACIVYVVLTYKTEIEDYWPNGGLTTLFYGLIIFVTIVANIASIGSTIAVERDWIVEICGRDGDLLASMTATLRRIDQLALTLAPVITGQIMTYTSTAIGALFIAAWNFVSVFLEYYLLWKVYNVVPALRDKMFASRTDKDTTNKNSETTPLLESDKYTSLRQDAKSGSTCCKCSMGNLCSGMVTLVQGWRTYMKYDVAFAGLGLAMLYMTVLGFDNVTVGYAYTQGLTESIIGIAMAAGALSGILGTYIYPVLRHRVGQVRAGLYGLFMEISVLSLCVASVWAPGSPFDPLNWKNVQPAQVCHQISSGSNSSYDITTNETFSFGGDLLSQDTTTGNSSLIEYTTTDAYNLTTPYYTSTVVDVIWNETASNMTEMCEDAINGPDSYLSIILLISGIVLARCGLWLTDLAITQQFLETVSETERGVVNGVQNSLNQLMDMLKFTMVIVAPETEVFGVLVIISFGCVCLGWLFYALYVRRVRGHLIHFPKC